MNKSRITIFSNGIADYRRVFSLSGPTNLSIPVKKEHLADVLSSLGIYGNAKLTVNPTYRPENENHVRLSLDSDQVFLDLVRKLVGTKVTVITVSQVQHEGRLTGVASDEQATWGEAIHAWYIVLQTSTGISRVRVQDVIDLRINDDSINKEIKKALDCSYEKIRPDSTQISLTLEPVGEGKEATVHYTVPSAAWKMSFRIREDGGKYTLEGYAHVDNNTEEDWKDSLLAVVTGEPITFATDLAIAKQPQRSTVNLVSDMVVGAVETQAVHAVRSIRRQKQNKVIRSELGFSAAADETDESVQIGTVATAEVGDFGIFETAEPVNIDAGCSAIIPVFQSNLGDAEAVLFFNPNNHPERAYRAIRFKNTTDHSLGRGVCSVFQDGRYAGQAVLPAMKPGDNQFCIHALDTGYRLWSEHKDQRVLFSLACSGGVVVQKFRNTVQTTYHIQPSGVKENLPIYLEHPVDKTSRISATYHGKQVAFEAIKNKLRFKLDATTDKSELIVDETVFTAHKVEMRPESAVGWFRSNFIESTEDMLKDKTVLACIAIQAEIDKQKRQKALLSDEKERLKNKQVNLRENIKATEGEGKLKFSNELQLVYDAIAKIDDEGLPTLENKIEELTQQLGSALKNIAVEWKGSTK